MSSYPMVRCKTRRSVDCRLKSYQNLPCSEVFTHLILRFLTYLVCVYIVIFNNQIRIFRQENASTGAMSTYPMVRCKTRRSADRHLIPPHQNLPFSKVFTHLIGSFLTYLVFFYSHFQQQNLHFSPEQRLYWSNENKAVSGPSPDAYLPKLTLCVCVCVCL